MFRWGRKDQYNLIQKTIEFFHVCSIKMACDDSATMFNTNLASECAHKQRNTRKWMAIRSKYDIYSSTCWKRYLTDIRTVYLMVYLKRYILSEPEIRQQWNICLQTLFCSQRFLLNLGISWTPLSRARRGASGRAVVTIWTILDLKNKDKN